MVEKKKVNHVISDFANITKTIKDKNCNRPKTFLTNFIAATRFLLTSLSIVNFSASVNFDEYE